MKIVFFFMLISCCSLIKAQTISYTDKITPDYYKQIVKNANKAAEDFRAAEKKENPEIGTELLGFKMDTFKINFIERARHDVDYCTSCMIVTVNDKAVAYDKLLNKYYNLLLVRLKTKEDKAILANAQKAWLVYRAKEILLWQKLSETKYSGGGTIQSIISASKYTEILEKRTIEIANYYFDLYNEE